MPDYYDVERKKDGSYKVTPQNNPSPWTIVIGVFVLFVIIACVVRCDNGRSLRPSTNATENNLDILLEENTTLSLFDLPTDRVVQGSIKMLTYDDKYESIDLDGNEHIGHHMLLCNSTDHYIRYNIKGKFRTLTGKLYAKNKGTVGWLEFYDGDMLIYKTPQLNEDNTSFMVDLNISNVEYLSVYFCGEGSAWLIAEDFIISK